MKKFALLVAAVLVITCFSSAALAASGQHKCPKCEKVTTWGYTCSNKHSSNSSYIQHTVNKRTCNYYYDYYKTKRKCTECGNVYYEGQHKECEIHDICGSYSRCPF